MEYSEKAKGMIKQLLLIIIQSAILFTFVWGVNSDAVATYLLDGMTPEQVRSMNQ